MPNATNVRNPYQGTNWLDVFNSECPKYGVDPFLAYAISNTESALQPFTSRYEHLFNYLVRVADFAKALKITEMTEQVHQKTSWGLMQTMGAVARELGFKDHLVKLTIPEISIEYGCRKINTLMNRYSDVSDVVSAYNMGSAKKTAEGVYLNKEYVNNIMKLYRKLSLGLG